MDRQYEQGYNAYHEGHLRDETKPKTWLEGYDHAEGGGLLHTTEYLNDR